MLKQTFITKLLHDYNQTVIAAMRAEMARLNVHDTGASDQSFAYKVFQAGNNGAYSELTFAEYLRFVDMGVGRGHPLGGLEATKLALTASRREGIAYVKDRFFKPRKIYSKIAYGKLPYLTGKLLYGYTDEVVAELKKELENKQP